MFVHCNRITTKPPFGWAPLRLRLQLLSPTKRFSRMSCLEPFFSEKGGAGAILEEPGDTIILIYSEIQCL